MDALDYCWRRRRLMERYGLVPLLLSIVSAWTLLLLGVSETKPSPALFAVLGVQVLILLPPSVAWYRAVVYGADADVRPMFTFTRLEVRLLLWQVLAVLLLALSVGLAVFAIAALAAGARAVAGDIAAALVAAPLAVGLLVLTIVGATRLSMVYALAALDTPASFRIAWQLTRGVAWRLTGSLVVVTLAVVLFGALAELAAWIVGAIIATLRGSEISAVVPYVRAVAQAPTSLLWLFATATLFGMVYASRAGGPPDSAQPARAES